MFVDMTDSTSMKEKEPEASWLTTYAWFFDLVAEKVNDSGGEIVKYLGDGLMAFYDLSNVANAINAAIAVQEALKEAARERQVYVNCTVGIATGKFRSFQTENGLKDYIGSVVDKAARLGSVASPKAIFIDRSTVNSALMARVQSQLGRLLNLSVDDYIGSLQKISLKGFSQFVQYHEIKWDQQLFGLKSQVATDAAEEEPRPPDPRPPSSPQDNEQHTGAIERWIDDKGFGFITDTQSQESFYVNTYYFAGRGEIFINDKVFFFARDALAEGKNRVAAAVVVVGETLVGKLVHINYEKRIAFAEVSDRNDNTMSIFAYLGDVVDDYQRGEMVEFEVGYNQRGPVVENIRKVS